jgi:FkbH-like protein
MTGRRAAVKCVVWDLDNTLWEGVLLEGDAVRLRDEVVATIRELDGRGILHSIASRNDAEAAQAKLRELELADLFVAPQISWGPKSAAVAEVARELNIATDSLAFVDDDPFERDEVRATHPDVLCIDASEAGAIAGWAELTPRFVTEDSRRRRAMVQAEIERKSDEAVMAPADFLASIGLTLTIGAARPDDLARVEELTLRTNQLNSTGYTYSYDELASLVDSDRHRLWIAGLDDRYGAYGKIGLALVELHDDSWLLRLLLVSCRVMARGVGSVLLTHVLSEAERAGTRLQAEFVRTDRNRPMYVMLRMAGFQVVGRGSEVTLLEHDLSAIPSIPDHVEVVLLDPRPDRAG